MYYSRSIVVAVFCLLGMCSSPALGCTFVEKFSIDDTRHILVGRIISLKSAIYDGESVLGLEVQPVHEFTQDNQRIGRNYELYPTGNDSLCNSYYLQPQSLPERYYEVGQLVTVYGAKQETGELGDLRVGTHRVEPIRHSCNTVEYLRIPSPEDVGNNCLSDMFHLYRVVAMFPTASDSDVDKGLRWLSESWYLLPYRTLVETYGDPDKAETYLRLRYGDVLGSECGERPGMWPGNADQKEKDANRLLRKRWFEYCEM